MSSSESEASSDIIADPDGRYEPLHTFGDEFYPLHFQFRFMFLPERPNRRIPFFDLLLNKRLEKPSDGCKAFLLTGPARVPPRIG